MPGAIFLDFDGPIFPQKVLLLPENRHPQSTDMCAKLNLHFYINYWKADPIAIAMLNNLYAIYPYDLVVSSSWADEWLHEKSQIEAVLNANDLNYDLHKDWRTPRDKYDTRHEQISLWLQEHPQYKDKYIIIDDVKSGDALADPDSLINIGINKDNVFLVDVEEGLTYKDYLAILDKIKTW